MKTLLKENAILFVLILLGSLLLNVHSSKAADHLTFSWTVEPDLVASQNIEELRVYQDTWGMEPFAADPLSGKIEIPNSINECSKFWATYASDTAESDKTVSIKVCKDRERVDPGPAEREVVSSPGGVTLIVPPGYTATIEASEQ